MGWTIKAWHSEAEGHREGVATEVITSIAKIRENLTPESLDPTNGADQSPFGKEDTEQLTQWISKYDSALSELAIIMARNIEAK